MNFFVFKLRNIEILLQDHVFSDLRNNLYIIPDRENINYITKCVSLYLQLQKNSSYATRREFNTKRILGASKKIAVPRLPEGSPLKAAPRRRGWLFIYSFHWIVNWVLLCLGETRLSLKSRFFSTSGEEAVVTLHFNSIPWSERSPNCFSLQASLLQELLFRSPGTMIHRE